MYGALTRVGRAITGGLLAATLIVAVAASSASAEHVVAPSKFPTVAAVARALPDYRGGGRELSGQRQVQIVADDCQGLDAAGIQPRAGKAAIYTDRRGLSPYFRGGTNVVFAIADYRKPSRARAAFDEQLAAVGSCYGRHGADGFTNTLTRLPAPTFAQGSFSYREVVSQPGTRPDRFIHTYYRQGRFMVLVFLQRNGQEPSVDAAFALTRASVRAVVPNSTRTSRAAEADSAGCC